MAVVSAVRDVETQQRVVEELCIEQVFPRLQHLCTVRAKNEREVHKLQATGVVAEDDQRKPITNDSFGCIGVARNESLALVNNGELTRWKNVCGRNLVLLSDHGLLDCCGKFYVLPFRMPI